jgi:hypothetical protein
VRVNIELSYPHSDYEIPEVIDTMVDLMIATAEHFNQEYSVAVYIGEFDFGVNDTSMPYLATHMIWQDGRYLGNWYTVYRDLFWITPTVYDWRRG